MLRLAVFKARRTVGMDAAAQLFVAVLPVQAFRKTIAHVPIKFRAQPGDGQQTLVIARRTFQHHGGSEAVLLNLLKAVAGHVVDKDVIPVIR